VSDHGILAAVVYSTLLIALPVPLLRAQGQGETDHNDTVLTGPIHPQLSRDGKTIAFSYQGAIWRMPSTGGAMTRLTAEPGFDVQPAVSPDGQDRILPSQRSHVESQIDKARARFTKLACDN
jgi:hypothetical protein